MHTIILRTQRNLNNVTENESCINPKTHTDIRYTFDRTLHCGGNIFKTVRVSVNSIYLQVILPMEIIDF